MKNDAALSLVKELVAEMGVSTANVTEAASLRTDLALNSLNLLILLVRIQERAAIEFAAQPDSVSKFQTVGDLVRALADGS